MLIICCTLGAFAPLAMAQRAAAPANQRTETTRAATVQSRAAAPAVQTRSAGMQNVVPRAAVPNAQTVSARTASPRQPARSAPASARSAISARSALAPVDTRVGAAYEQCKGAYFACMDQFCEMKNQSFQRCSCSDRIYDITSAQNVMQDAATQLTQFNENLDTVGMTANQAASLRTATEGELALSDDKSAAKALLNAIMNAIRGEDSNMGGRYQQLNSISLGISLDAGFGGADAQAIASYNGANLYTAIYGKCRQAVRPDCTDASLQRAVTAYLMMIEQDCNTLQKKIDNAKKTLGLDVRESGAMLDLARVQNRQNLNQKDATACLREVESAILSEQVCGPGYRKCLDNGQFIDIKTGRPFEGVVEFYKLAQLLTFSDNLSLADQRLARVPANRDFVMNFEKRTKQFAIPVLNKCTEISDEVWADFLDKALLEIYYAQTAKVNEIKQGCMDFVSMCFMNGEKALTQSMASLVDDTTTNQPGFLAAVDAVCGKYIDACNNMFSGDIIAQYIETRKTEDVTAACRAVVQNCFDKFGGKNYENLFFPNSGLITQGAALDWFSFDSKKCTTEVSIDDETDEKSYTACTWSSVGTPSECARELLTVDACAKDAREIFGGFTKLIIDVVDGEERHSYGEFTNNAMTPEDMDSSNRIAYTGVATEVYYRIIDTLRTKCENRQGTFTERRFDNSNNIECTSGTKDLCPWYASGEVETKSWGVCLKCPLTDMIEWGKNCTGPWNPDPSCLMLNCGCEIGPWLYFPSVTSPPGTCSLDPEGIDLVCDSSGNYGCGKQCPPNSSLDSSCREPGGQCVRIGCRCNNCYKPGTGDKAGTCILETGGNGGAQSISICQTLGGDNPELLY